MDKRNHIKAGVNFGIAMAVFFILQNLFTADHLTTKEIVGSIISGLIGGASGGLLFGCLMRLTAKAYTKGINLVLHENETILFKTQANHFKAIEAVGGILYLTDQRVVFKSHKFNIQKHTLSINLDEIASVDKYKVFGFSNNGLLIKTKNGLKEKFTVLQPEEWLQQVENSKLPFW